MKTILVTGAGRGLGLEFARQYAADGWRVLAAARHASPALQALAGSAGGYIRILPLDVADHANIERLAVDLRDEPIDILLNNAGYLGRIPFAAGGVASQAFGKVDYDDWELTLRVNVFGPMKMTEAFATHVARSTEKKVVTLTSMVGSMALNTLGGLYGYRSSKAAVNAVMKSMSIDLAKQGILAVALHPGWVRTDMGGPGAQIEAVESVAGMRRFIAGFTADLLGRVYAYDGQPLPY